MKVTNKKYTSKHNQFKYFIGKTYLDEKEENKH